MILAGVQTYRLARDVLQQLEALSVTSADNIQWNLIQSEVEFIQLQLVIAEAESTLAQNLAEVRQRFDIFYSRVDTFHKSPVYTRYLRTSGAVGHLERTQSFLDRWVPVIDGPDAQLVAAGSRMRKELKELRPDVRAFVLLAMRTHAVQSDTRRDRVFDTLASLGLSALGLVATLFAGVIVLWRMYRRLGGISRYSEEVRGRLEAIITSSLDPILVIRNDGKIEEFNQSATGLFGGGDRQLKGRQVARIFSYPKNIGSNPVTFAALREAAENTEENRVQLLGKRGDGTTFPAELSLSAVSNRQENFLVAFVRDISDRLRNENDLREARDEALAGEKAKSNLLTVMSHEMRTPLNGVLGALDILESQGLRPEQVRFVDAIRVSGDLLLHHVNDVLELSWLEGGEGKLETSDFDLDSLVRSLVDSQQAVARNRGIELSLSVQIGRSPVVTGAPRLVQKALLNLVGNALKYTRNGRVSVEICRVNSSVFVEFLVEDTGRGIAAEDLERIFEAFVTADTSYARPHEGTGLGLTITRQMVEFMGGTISAESVKGKGSRFRFRVPLPVVDDETCNPVLPHRPKEHLGETGNLRMLVVEDNEINRLLLTELLTSAGHDVTEAEDGFGSVEIASRKEFDLIFMDISMPGMDGRQAAELIGKKGLNQETPIVAITAHAGARNREELLSGRFVQVLAKPYQRSELSETIARWAGGAAAEIPEDGSAREGSLSASLGKDKYARLANSFLMEMDDFTARTASAETSDGEIRRLAHNLAGSAAMFGFHKLVSLLNQVEDASDKNLHGRLAELDAAFARARIALQEST